MLKYVPLVGENITETARKMILLANQKHNPVVAEFNDIELTAKPSVDTADNIVKFYQKESSRRAEEYRKSPEGQRAAQEAKERQQQLQAQMDEAMVELPGLDFSDYNTVITWFEKIRDASDHIGVNVPHKQIVATFRQHGYKPGVNTDKDFNGEDKENFARYLIGQALKQLQGVSLGGGPKFHAIHHIFHNFATDWRKKFGYA